MKITFIAAQPGVLPDGVVNRDLLSHYDVLPTLLDYLNMENPEADSLPGRSFAPLLRGESLTGRDSVVVFDEYGPVRMIRTREWKYVHRYPYGPHELYSLVSDPGEEQNLIDRPEHAAVQGELRAKLERWFVRYVNPEIDGAREAVAGKGQMGLAGARGDGVNTHGADWFYIDEEGKRRV